MKTMSAREAKNAFGLMKAEAMAARLSAEVFDQPPPKGNRDASAQAGQ